MDDSKPRVVKVQKIKPEKLNGEELLAQICYYYPAYTLDTASKLSYRQVILLLRVANKQRAMHYYNLTQIIASPNTKKGAGVKKLSDHFKEQANKKL